MLAMDESLSLLPYGQIPRLSTTILPAYKSLLHGIANFDTIMSPPVTQKFPFKSHVPA